MDGAERLARRVAALRGCSRAEAERLILGGWVRVDGAVQDQPPTRVNEAQVVTVDEGARAQAVGPVTLLWHQPAGTRLPEAPFLPDALADVWLAPAACASAGPGAAGFGPTPVRAHRHRQQMPVRLAAAESGLMVFTQVPAVARRLTDARVPLEAEWFIDVATAPSDRAAVLASFNAPLAFDGRPLLPARASWASDRRLRVVVRGAVPGQVSHLAARAGLAVAALHRHRLGRIGLASLAPGQWRYVAASERF